MDSGGTNQTRLTFEIGGTRAPVWSPNGRQIAYNRSSPIHVINANGRNVRQLTKHNEKKVLHPDWFPDGKLITFNRIVADDLHHHANIYIVDPVTRSVKKVTDLGFNSQSPKRSPDGRWILFEEMAISI